MAFDAAGNVVQSWGGPSLHPEWPESNHGIIVDHKGNVWIGGNGQPDAHILKFTREGKFVAQFGKKGARRDPANPNAYVRNADDLENFGRVAKVFIDSKANEAYVSDGYFNKRVAVIDMDSGKVKRYWGGYGEKPDNETPPPYNPKEGPSRQFRTPVHCAEVSNDGFVYVCDRPNDRIQVFTKEGKFVKEKQLFPETLSDGSVWDIAFSRDPQQKLPVRRRWRQRARLHRRPAVARGAHELRHRRPPAGDVLRRAQHRDGLEGQHLHHGDLHREAPAEVRLQGPRAGDHEDPGHALADANDAITLTRRNW